MLVTDDRADILTALDNAWLSRQVRIVDGKDTGMVDRYIDQLLDALGP